MSDVRTPPALYGRGEDADWLRSLVADAADGHGQAAVVLGEPGVGKTFLVTTVLSQISTVLYMSISGVETEMDLPYAALQRIVLAYQPLTDQIPEVQRTALLTAAGLETGSAPGRSQVGLGLLALLSDLAQQVPVACFVDDAQWIDPESLAVFAFVARRISSEKIAVLFAVRSDTGGVPALAGIVERTLTGLDPRAARKLLGASTGAPLDHHVAEQIVAATGGNPLALVDLSEELTRAQLLGENLLPEPIPLGNHLEAHYLRRVESLPAGARQWLTIAAAEPDGDPSAIAAAAFALGLPSDAAQAAEAAGLVRIAAHVSFRHPLVRSAIYNGALSHVLSATHLELAEVAHSRGDRDRWVAHRASAAAGFDEELALELEAAADRAASRGGYMTRTSLLLRAATLTSDERTKTRFELAASESALAAGARDRARALIARIDPRRLDAHGQGRLAVAKTEMVLDPTDTSSLLNRPSTLLKAVRLFRSTDPRRAKLVLSLAFWGSVQADYPAQKTTAIELAEEARLLQELSPGTDLIDLSLGALAAVVLGDNENAPELVRRAEIAALDPDASPEEFLHSYMCAAYAADLLHHRDARDQIIIRAEHIARDMGATWVLTRVLLVGAYFDAQDGRVRGGRRRLSDATVLMQDQMGGSVVQTKIITEIPLLRAWTGDDLGLRDETGPGAESLQRAGYGASVTGRTTALMLIEVASGDYDAAWRLGRTIRTANPLFAGALHLPNLIECAAHAGDTDAAQELFERFEKEVESNPSPWAQGLLQRSLGLILVNEDSIEALTRSAEIFDGVHAVVDAARSHLLIGERLRRRRRRGAAATHLTLALEGFQSAGATAWTARPNRELAVLEPSSTPAKLRDSELTSQESAVARLAAAGSTNAEIAAQLFLTSSTVDYHLRKVFRKLRLTSRRQLRGLRLD